MLEFEELMNTKILIIGASGFLGYSLFQKFSKNFDILGTYYSNKTKDLVHLNFLDQNELNSIISEFKPSVILLPAAMPNVEYCEINFDDCWKYNVKGPLNIINLLKKSNIKLVFYSSDYIFDGKNGPYSESDLPNPLNNYGKAKLETENNIKSNLSNYLIIRTTIVYGWERNRKNFIYRLIDTLKDHKILKVPKDQIGTPTYVEDLAEATLQLVQKDQIGIFNVVGSELISRYQFSLIAADIFDLDPTLIIPVYTKDLGQVAARPLNAGLKIDKLLRTINVKMSTPIVGLKKMYNKISELKK